MRGALLKRSPAGGRFLYSVAKFVLHCPHRRRWQSSQGIKAVLDISRRSALVLGSTTPLAYSSLSSQGTAIEAMSTESLKDAVKDIVPTLSGDLAKGQAGKIGVIGGCREYTGAPYFAAISALKIGADLSHVFCTEGAATVIKSYSPELIVHPYLPDSHDPTSLSDEDRVNEAVGAIDHWMERFDAIVIGPGLGRDTLVHETVKKVLVKLKEKRKPVVIDADGLYITTKNLNLIKGYDLAVLTPNKNEFQRLANELNVSLDNQSGQSDENILKDITSQLGGPLLLRKGTADQVCDGQEVWNNSEAGSKRRAGGQGDVLSGCLAVMISWALSKQQQKDDMQQIKKDLVIAAFGGSLVARHAQKAAFEKCGRSMLAQDVIDQLGATVDRLFDV